MNCVIISNYLRRWIYISENSDVIMSQHFSYSSHTLHWIIGKYLIFFDKKRTNKLPANFYNMKRIIHVELSHPEHWKAYNGIFSNCFPEIVSLVIWWFLKTWASIKSAWYFTFIIRLVWFCSICLLILV